MFVVPGRILEFFLVAPGIGAAMDLPVEGRAPELAIESTLKAVPWFEATMDSEGRLLELLTPRAVSWLPGATWDSEGRSLELTIELTPRMVSWLPEATEGRALELALIFKS